MGSRSGLLALWFLVSSTGGASSGDVAFWKPYQSDSATYALFHFEFS